MGALTLPCELISSSSTTLTVGMPLILQLVHSTRKCKVRCLHPAQSFFFTHALQCIIAKHTHILFSLLQRTLHNSLLWSLTKICTTDTFLGHLNRFPSHSTTCSDNCNLLPRVQLFLLPNDVSLFLSFWSCNNASTFLAP